MADPKPPLPNRSEFIRYLRDGVIPELREIGANMTADDFELALRFLENEDRRKPLPAFLRAPHLRVVR